MTGILHSILPSDYQTVMQNTNAFFLSPALKGCKSKINKRGMPRAFTGGFATVFSVLLSNGENKALRLFTTYGDDAKKRYAGLSSYITQNPKNYFVRFEFLQQAVLVKGIAHPLILMDWITGDSLGTYIQNNLHNKLILNDIKSDCIALFLDLKANHIAHGDLSHSNIIYDSSSKSLKLIDYDGMYCTQTSNLQSVETGLPHYQHPERRADHYGSEMDNFSMWIIICSLEILIDNPKHYSGQDCIVFNDVDIKNISLSPIILLSKRSTNNKIRYIGTV